MKIGMVAIAAHKSLAKDKETANRIARREVAYLLDGIDPKFIYYDEGGEVGTAAVERDGVLYAILFWRWPVEAAVVCLADPRYASPASDQLRRMAWKLNGPGEN